MPERKLHFEHVMARIATESATSGGQKPNDPFVCFIKSSESGPSEQLIEVRSICQDCTRLDLAGPRRE